MILTMSYTALYTKSKLDRAYYFLLKIWPLINKRLNGSSEDPNMHRLRNNTLCKPYLDSGDYLLYWEHHALHSFLHST